MKKKMYEVEQHYVTFYSPGTFFPEKSTKKIKKWDVPTAIRMAKKIKERYNATPYGFQFSTDARKKDWLDSKTVKESKFHFLGGKILTLEQVKERKDPNDKILISNMVNNKFSEIIENTNSWKVCLPYDRKKHVYLEFNP